MADYDNIAILYLDDEDINLFLFEANFKKKFEVLTANTSEKAMTILEENKDKIIVVISDMRMPVLSGVEFVQQAKEKYSNIFYYILTGFEYSEEIENAIESDLIQKFFKKPFNVSEIEEEVLRAAKELHRI